MCSSFSQYIPWKYFTKFQCNSGWSFFERFVLVLLLVLNFALLLIVLPVVSSNTIKLSYILGMQYIKNGKITEIFIYACLTDNLESSHGIHKSSQIIVNKTHGIVNSIKEQVDWINTTQEQMKGQISTMYIILKSECISLQVEQFRYLF